MILPDPVMTCCPVTSDEPEVVAGVGVGWANRLNALFQADGIPPHTTRTISIPAITAVGTRLIRFLVQVGLPRIRGEKRDAQFATGAAMPGNLGPVITGPARRAGKRRINGAT